MYVVIDIPALLPHRYPILLVDHVTDLVAGERLTAIKAVTRNEPCYADESAGPAYPVALLLESWVQAAALLAVYPDGPAPETDLLLGSVGNVTVGRPVLPGEVVTHLVYLTRALGDTLLFEGSSTVDGVAVQTIGQAVLAFRPQNERAGSTHA